MKTLAIIMAAMVLLGGCQQRRTDGRTGKSGMQMDSLYEKDPNVTVIRGKSPIRLDESMKELKDYPNITLADLDAENGVESKEITYVKKGEKLRLGEPSRGK